MSDKATILIVDDVDELRNVLAVFLEEAGYQTKKASNGIEALEVLSNTEISVLITDVLMPEMDGVELISTVLKSHPEMKFIIISGGGRQVNSQYDYLVSAQKLTGVKNVLEKPFESSALIEMVEKVLAE